MKDRESIRLFDRRYAREVSRRRRFVKLGERSYSTFYRRPINISRLFGAWKRPPVQHLVYGRASSNLSSWQTWAAPATFRKPSITRANFHESVTNLCERAYNIYILSPFEYARERIASNSTTYNPFSLIHLHLYTMMQM